MAEERPIEMKVLKVLVETGEDLSVSIKGSKDGFHVDIASKGSTYTLYTQRKNRRVFKSPDTAIGFLGELGVESAKIEGIQDWASDRQ